MPSRLTASPKLLCFWLAYPHPVGLHLVHFACYASVHAHQSYLIVTTPRAYRFIAYLTIFPFRPTHVPTARPIPDSFPTRILSPTPEYFHLCVSQLSSDLTHLFCFLIVLVIRTYKPITKSICRLLISLHKHLQSLSDSASLIQQSPLLTDSLLIDTVSHVYK
jgi:hypothetical protein